MNAIKKFLILNFQFSIEGGYVAILSVLTIAAIAASVGFSLLILGVNNAKSSVSNGEGAMARSLANLCAEEALEKISATPSYTGTTSTAVTISAEGSCGYTIGSGTGEIRAVYATGSATISGTSITYSRTVTISVGAISPNMTISSWQETP